MKKTKQPLHQKKAPESVKAAAHRAELLKLRAENFKVWAEEHGERTLAEDREISLCCTHYGQAVFNVPLLPGEVLQLHALLADSLCPQCAGTGKVKKGGDRYLAETICPDCKELWEEVRAPPRVEPIY